MGRRVRPCVSDLWDGQDSIGAAIRLGIYGGGVCVRVRVCTDGCVPRLLDTHAHVPLSFSSFSCSSPMPMAMAPTTGWRRRLCFNTLTHDASRSESHAGDQAAPRVLPAAADAPPNLRQHRQPAHAAGQVSDWLADPFGSLARIAMEKDGFAHIRTPLLPIAQPRHTAAAVGEGPGPGSRRAT